MEPESLREIYRECMRNHAAKLGTYAADGCCEFIPDDAQLGTLHCGACGCHRNFHRKDYSCPSAATPASGYLQPAEARRRQRTKFSAEQKARMSGFAEKIGWKMPKRDGEGEGEGEGEDEVSRFCMEIGVSRQVFKVWLHNHKHSSVAGAASATDSTAGAVAPAVEEGGEEVKGASDPMEEK